VYDVTPDGAFTPIVLVVLSVNVSAVLLPVKVTLPGMVIAPVLLIEKRVAVFVIKYKAVASLVPTLTGPACPPFTT